MSVAGAWPGLTTGKRSDMRPNTHEPRWTYRGKRGNLDEYRCTRCGRTVTVRPGASLPTAPHDD